MRHAGIVREMEIVACAHRVAELLASMSRQAGDKRIFGYAGSA